MDGKVSSNEKTQCAIDYKEDDQQQDADNMLQITDQDGTHHIAYLPRKV